MNHTDRANAANLLEQIQRDRNKLANEVREDIESRDPSIKIGALEPMGPEWLEYIYALADDCSTVEKRQEILKRLMSADIRRVTNYGPGREDKTGAGS